MCFISSDHMLGTVQSEDRAVLGSVKWIQEDRLGTVQSEDRAVLGSVKWIQEDRVLVHGL